MPQCSSALVAALDNHGKPWSKEGVSRMEARAPRETRGRAWGRAMRMCRHATPLRAGGLSVRLLFVFAPRALVVGPGRLRVYVRLGLGSKRS